MPSVPPRNRLQAPTPVSRGESRGGGQSEVNSSVQAAVDANSNRGLSAAVNSKNNTPEPQSSGVVAGTSQPSTYNPSDSFQQAIPPPAAELLIDLQLESPPRGTKRDREDDGDERQSKRDRPDGLGEELDLIEASLKPNQALTGSRDGEGGPDASGVSLVVGRLRKSSKEDRRSTCELRQNDDLTEPQSRPGPPRQDPGE